MKKILILFAVSTIWLTGCDWTFGKGNKKKQEQSKDISGIKKLEDNKGHSDDTSDDEESDDSNDALGQDDQTGHKGTSGNDKDDTEFINRRSDQTDHQLDHSGQAFEHVDKENNSYDSQDDFSTPENDVVDGTQNNPKISRETEISNNWKQQGLTLTAAIDEFKKFKAVKENSENDNEVGSYMQALLAYSKELATKEKDANFEIIDKGIALKTGLKEWQTIKFENDDQIIFLYAYQAQTVGLRRDHRAHIPKTALSLNYLELAAYWGYNAFLEAQFLEFTSDDFNQYINSSNSVPLAFARTTKVAALLKGKGALSNVQVRELTGDDKAPWTVLNNLPYIKAPEEVIELVKDQTQGQ